MATDAVLAASEAALLRSSLPSSATPTVDLEAINATWGVPAAPLSNAPDQAVPRGRRRRGPRALPNEAARERCKEYSVKYRARRKLKVQSLEDCVAETGERVAAAREEHAALRQQNGALASLDTYTRDLLSVLDAEPFPISDALGPEPCPIPDAGAFGHADSWGGAAANDSADHEMPSRDRELGSAVEQGVAVRKPGGAQAAPSRGALDYWVQKKIVAVVGQLSDRLSDRLLRWAALKCSRLAAVDACPPLSAPPSTRSAAFVCARRRRLQACTQFLQRAAPFFLQVVDPCQLRRGL